MQTYRVYVGDVSTEQIKNRDKMGGLPTYLPNSIPKPDLYGGHFLMEIYNRGFKEEDDVICWQFYQGEFGGDIAEVLEIKKGAPLYDDASNLITKRRWLREYPLLFEACESEQVDENTSRLGGEIPAKMAGFVKKKKIHFLGVIKGDICPNNEFNSAYDIIIGFDKAGRMNAWTFTED